jgi:LPS-assembly lipoprotein
MLDRDLRLTELAANYRRPHKNRGARPRSPQEQEGYEQQTMKTPRLLALFFSALVLASCTVAPLYGTNATQGFSATKAGLSQVHVKSGGTRAAQLVTNELIFLFHGGGKQPANAVYELEVKATRTTTGAAPVYVGGNRLAGLDLTIVAIYNLSDSETGSVVRSGRKRATGLYGSGTQEFANTRAGIDAEKRAAREVAEFIRIDVAKALATRGGAEAQRLTERDLEEAAPIEDFDPDPRTIEDVQ